MNPAKLVSPAADAKSCPLSMKLIGANSCASVVGLDMLQGKTNYFVGNDRKKWRTNVANYARVKCQNVYPGIDMIYYGNQRQLEYDFKVAPGADFKAIGIRYDGARRIRIDDSGDLLIELSAGEIRQRRPVIYQEEAGARREIAGRYVLQNVREVSFEIGSHNKSKPLIIDPVLTYSTYLGGSLQAAIKAVAVDSAGNAYVAGTSVGDFPGTGRSPGSQTFDCFVAKLNPSGTKLLYSTIIGPGEPSALAVDAAGNAYITGISSSSNFPTTPNAFARSIRGGLDIFVTKLNPEGNDLTFSTLIGGRLNEQSNSIAIDSEGDAYITGDTQSQDYPTERPLRITSAGEGVITSGDGFKPQLQPIPPRYVFATKLNSRGSRLVYSTYLGNPNIYTQQMGYGIVVDSAGNAYVAGTATNNLPTTPGAFQRDSNGSSDAFVVKLAPEGTRIIFGTYLGGSGNDAARGIALDEAGNIYIAGRTTLADFPTTQGVVQPHNSDGSFFRSTDGGITWNPSSRGLSASAITRLFSGPSPSSTLYTFQNSDLIFTGSSIETNRLLRSTDQGASWSATTTSPTPASINTLAIDPVNPSTIYVGVVDSIIFPGRGVVKSTDGGDTWKPINDGLNSLPSVFSLDIDPSNPSTVYAGTNAGVFKTTDGGDHWAGTGLPIGSIVSLAIDPKTTSTIYATSGSVIKSTDGGNSWKATQRINNTVQRVVIDPVTPSTVYAVTFNSIYKTADGGASWRELRRIIPGLDFYSVNAMAIDPFNSTTLYAGTSRGVYKSVDGGESWTETGFVSSGAVDSTFYTHTVALDLANPSTVYVGTTASTDAFVAKLDPTASRLIYSTYLGGIGEDFITRIAVDTAGNAYVAGFTISARFPTTADGVVIPSSLNNVGDAFVAGLNANGSALTYSTYLGGTRYDIANDIAVDASKKIYVVGSTVSPDLGTTSGSFRQSQPGQASGFVVKLSFLKITGVSVAGKNLIVMGEGFDKNARVLINGEPQKTKNDKANPASVLVAKKALKNVTPGQRWSIRVVNPDSTLSNEIIFMRPVE